MSLQDNKNALFGKAPMSSVPESKKTSTSTSSSTITSSSSSGSKNTSSRLTVSPELKAKKLAEARENEEKAQKALKTSIFQWSPDHILAGSSYDIAGGAYKTAEEFESAIQAFLKAADSHEACDSYGAAALSLQKAAEISKQLGRSEQTASIYVRTSQLWGLRGEIIRVGEFLCKAAKELETVDPAKAKEHYINGIDYICPPETTVDQMNSCPALGPELFGDILKFHFKYRATQKNLPASSYRISLPEVLAFANRVINVYDGLEMEASACRLRVTITLLQLESGDVIAADKTFLDHLSNNNYLKSNESKLAEMFLMAFKQMDIDQLDEAQKSHILIHLDRDIQAIAKGLSLLANHNAPISAIVPSKTSVITTSNSNNNNINNINNNNSNNNTKISPDHQRKHESQNEYDDDEPDTEFKSDNANNNNNINNEDNNNGEDEEDFDALVEASTNTQTKAADEDELDLT